MLSAAAEIDDDELLAKSNIRRLINQMCTNCWDKNRGNKSYVMRTPHMFSELRVAIAWNKEKFSAYLCKKKKKKKNAEILFVPSAWKQCCQKKGL